MPLTQSLLCRVRPSATPVLFRVSPPALIVHRPLQLRVLRTSSASYTAHSVRRTSRSPFPPSNGRTPVASCPRTTPITLPTMASQLRGHASHGHHHHHHGSNVYLTSANKKDAGVRITRLGLFTNLSMVLGKFVGGYFFHSQALVADAYHALTDLFSDFLTLGTVSWSLKPPTERFPNGYGKVESIGALGVSSLLLAGGILMGLNSGQILLGQIYPEAAEAIAHLGLAGHSHGHGHDLGGLGGPNVNAAWLAGGSIVVKEWLYRTTMRIAKEKKSSVLASNAVHHRIDSLTSIVALFTIGGTYLFHNALWLDPVGGLLISLMVIKAGWGNTRTSLLELADSAIDKEVMKSVHKAVSKALARTNGYDVAQVRDIQGMKSGQNYLVDVELAVPGAWSVNETREVEELVRDSVGADVQGAKRVRVRFVPLELPDLKLSEEFVPPEVKSQHGEKLEDTEGEHHHDHDDHDDAHAAEESSRKRR